jgi:hypothetical protein
MHRTRRIPGLRIAAALLFAGVLACASAPPDHSKDLDRAVEEFIAGDYRSAVTELDAVIARSPDQAVQREAYTYLGRAHMALGETDAAVDAFSRGVQLGDTGPCVAYLSLLKQYVEGKPSGLHMSESLTRGQLAGAVARMFLGGVSTDPNGPTPVAQLERRGWMPRLADGRDHAADRLTRAALYVVAAHILADAGAANRVEQAMPGGYRAAARSTAPVSGTEALAVLERVRTLTTKQ